MLQDLVNELGRRLEYDVINGRYSGVVGQIGFDGLWSVPGQPAVVVEVKTTDAYRISLDTLVSYRDKLAQAQQCAADASILIVVGRQDTGELEAQIRGSRHAWDVRLISAEALLRLVEVKETTGQADTDEKIRGLLRPTEYTRLDALVDVVFSATKDVETLVDVGGRPTVEDEEGTETPKPLQPYDFTSPADLNQKRGKIIGAWSKRLNAPLIAKSRALFWSGDHASRAICTISKRYVKLPGRPYWYAYHPAWREFLVETKGHLLLGAMDLNCAFAIPSARLEPLLLHLNTTFKPDEKTYWHLHILEGQRGEFSLYVPSREPLALEEFSFSLD